MKFEYYNHFFWKLQLQRGVIVVWEEYDVDTSRGRFEYFVCGEGEPLAITHFYMAFDSRGNLFASPFTEHYKVYLINVRGAGNSAEIENDSQLSLKEMVKDLEAIREALGLDKWAFAGHSTGGMLLHSNMPLKHLNR